MNALAEKLAELLDLSVETAIELYPMLRTQFVLYSISDNLQGLLYGIITFLGVMMFLISIAVVVEDDLIETKLMSVLKWSLIGCVISAVLIAILIVLTPILAPDIVVIKGLL